MSWLKTNIDGLDMYEENGERKIDPEKEFDKRGCHAVTINGVQMWENSNGERTK
jgi:hypothetical protein